MLLTFRFHVLVGAVLILTASSPVLGFGQQGDCGLDARVSADQAAECLARQLSTLLANLPQANLAGCPLAASDTDSTIPEEFTGLSARVFADLGREVRRANEMRGFRDECNLQARSPRGRTSLRKQNLTHVLTAEMQATEGERRLVYRLLDLAGAGTRLGSAAVLVPEPQSAVATRNVPDCVNPEPLGEGMEVSRQLEGDPLRRCVSLEVTEGQTYILETTGDYDTVGTVYQADGTIVASNDDSGINNNAKVEWISLISGTVYGVIREYSQGPAEFNLSFGQGQPVESPCSEAPSVRIDEPVFMVLESGIDGVCAEAQISPGRLYEFYTTGPSDTIMQVFGLDDALLGEDDDSGQDYNAKVLVQTDRAETVRIRVFGYSQAEGEFTLHMTERSLDPDGYESNNSLEDATPLAAIAGQALTLGNLTLLDDDVDAFQLDLEQGTGYQIDVICDNVDTVMEIYNSTGESVAFNDDHGGSLCSFIWFSPVETGLYTIVISSYNGSGAFGSYDLQITAERSAQPDALEPNNTLESATALGSNEIIRELNLPSGDVDWFSIELSAGESVTFETDCGDGDTVLELLDSEGNFLDGNDDFAETTCSQLSFTAEDASVYYLQVSNYRDSVSWITEYRLLINR